jgi:hypothetical protein
MHKSSKQAKGAAYIHRHKIVKEKEKKNRASFPLRPSGPEN